MSTDRWDPDQYARFQAEREQPFHDLVSLLESPKPQSVADLGCGTGELTRQLHRTLRSAETVGVDSSPAMLARARELQEPGLRFVLADIEDWVPVERFQVLFSNAALQWVDDHHTLFSRLRAFLADGGELAVQMPANHDHASHLVAVQLALEEPFASATGGYVRTSPVLAPEAYAELLHQLGMVQVHVRLQVYGHQLSSPAEVAEWVRGTLLIAYQQRMPEAAFSEFLQRYRERLRSALGERRPYLYTFKRILLHARSPS